MPNNKLRPQEATLGTLRRIFRTISIDSSDQYAYCGTTSGDVLQVRGGGGGSGQGLGITFRACLPGCQPACLPDLCWAWAWAAGREGWQVGTCTDRWLGNAGAVSMVDCVEGIGLAQQHGRLPIYTWACMMANARHTLPCIYSMLPRRTNTLSHAPHPGCHHHHGARPTLYALWSKA